MSYICSYKCADVKFDVYDTERINKSITNYLFYITPNKLVEVQKYLIENNIPFIDSPEQMNLLIEKNLIGIY
jgi:hypothetical protein